MKHQQKLSFRALVLSLIMALVGLGFILTVTILTWQASQSQRSVALRYAEQLALEQSGGIARSLESALISARSLAQSMAGLKAGQPLRADADAIQRAMLEANPAFLGVWTGWEPNAFDGADSTYANRPGHDASGRYVPYWNRGGGTIQVAPLADYDKEGAGDYYQIARKTRQEALIEPYLYEVGGREVLITSVAAPILIDGRFVGVAGIDIALSSIQSEVAAIHPYETGYASLISYGGQYVADGDASNVGKPVNTTLQPHLAALRSGQQLELRHVDPGLATEVTRLFVPMRIGNTPTPWSFSITVPDDTILADVRMLRNTAIIISLVSLLVVLAGLAYVLERLVLRPLGGEPDTAAAIARRIAGGDLSGTIEARPGDTTSLMAALRDMQAQLAAVVQRVRENADGVASASAQIAQGNQDLSSRTEEQASALEQTASAMEELSATVRQNASNSLQASEMAGQATGIADQAGAVVGEVVQTMHGIRDSSQRIASIIATIDGISFQTNILALNAAVEAARAGESGRGFAVVASEVRTLAQRSAGAAREIRDLISTSTERVDQGAALVGRAKATMADVTQAIQRAALLMREVSVASQEQSTGVTQVGQAVSQMDHSTQQNAALVEESAAAAHSLQSQAEALVQTVAVFKV